MLEAQDLACLRGERVVFAGLSFRLAPGGALLLTGANGAGKSSLLRLLAGLLAPAEGALLWQGEDALADRAAHARRLRYVGHGDALKPALTARENLGFFARLWGGEADPALAALGLDAWPTCRRGCCPPDRSGGSAWRAWRLRRRRSGCWTSRRRASTPPRWSAWARCWRGTARRAGWWWRRRTCRCRCRAPGSFGCEGLARAAGAGAAARPAPPGGYAGGGAVLRPGRRALSLRHRPGARGPGADCPRRASGRRAAGGAAAAGPHVRRGCRGRVARPAAAVRPAAGGDRRGQGVGALVDHRPAPAGRDARRRRHAEPADRGLGRGDRRAGAGDRVPVACWGRRGRR